MPTPKPLAMDGFEKRTCHFGHEMKVVFAEFRAVDEGGGNKLLYRCDECGLCLHVEKHGMSIERLEETRTIYHLRVLISKMLPELKDECPEEVFDEARRAITKEGQTDEE